MQAVAAPGFQLWGGRCPDILLTGTPSGVSRVSQLTVRSVSRMVRERRHAPGPRFPGAW